MNKKAENLLPGTVSSIVIAVICLLALVLLVGGLWRIFANDDINKAEAVLEKIKEKTDYFKSSDYTEEKLYFELFKPGDEGDWYVINFEESFFPEEQCLGNYENCFSPSYIQ